MKRAIAAIITIIILSSFTSSEQIFLKWNFKNFKTLQFSYKQVMQMKTEMSADDIQEMEGNGILLLEIKDNSRADITIKDMLMRTYKTDASGNKILDMELPMPNLVISNLMENGEIKGDLNPQTETLARVLFPVLNKVLAVNEENDIPLKLTYNYFGQALVINGANKVKYIGDGKIETKIDVSEFEDKTITDKTCYLKGSSNYLFDNSKGYFTEGEIIINMALGKKGSVPAMEANSTITLKLQSVK